MVHNTSMPGGVTAFRCLLHCLVWLAIILCPRDGLAATYSLANSAVSVQVGKPITVNWSVSPGGVPKDWIGWYKTGDANNAFDQSRWRYTGGASSGSFTITAPSTPGTYEFRYLYNDGFNSMARSQPVTVTTGTVVATPISSTVGYSLTANPGSVQAGQSVTVSWSAATGVPKDWIGWYKTGDANNAFDQSRWRYTGGASSGSFTITAPSTPGTYEFRYLYNDGFNSMARSQPVTVTTGTVVATPISSTVGYSLTANPGSVQAGQSVTVSWSAATGVPKDWIGWYKTGDANNAFDQSRWRYTGGASSGSFTITAPSTPGTYEFRYLLNDGYTHTARSNPVTVAGVTTTSAPTVSLSANPSTINQGAQSQLSWSSANATSCTASGGWSGSKTLSGLQAVSPTATTSYTITCTGPAGSTYKTATVNVTTSSVSGGSTFYVATNGNDAYPGTESQPFKTLARAVSVLRPGDILLVRGGTYKAGYELANTPSGAASSPITIRAYPGEIVTLRVFLAASMSVDEATFSASIQENSGGGVYSPYGPVPEPVVPWYKQQYVILDGFIIDARKIGVNPVNLAGSGHIKILNSELKNGVKSGLADPAGLGFNEFINLSIHDNGVSTQWHHGLYLQTGNNLVDGCEIYNNGGYGVHIYGGWPNNNANIVRNSRIYNHRAKAGILAFTGENHEFYNNLIHGNRIGIEIMPGHANTFNNTIYGHAIFGIYINSSVSGAHDNNIVQGNGLEGPYTFDGIYLEASSGRQTFRNNLSAKNGLEGNRNFRDLSEGSAGHILQGNLFGSQYDAKFVNSSIGDFQLQPGSSAIDRGRTISGLTDDYAGSPRPKGAAYDIGAYE